MKPIPNKYVSIILLTYRQGERRLVSNASVQSILTNTNYPFELIMIDNTQNNRGLTDGRNLGLSMATGIYICIMDDDVIVLPRWMETCIKMLRRTDQMKYLVTPVKQRLVKKWELPPVGGFRCNARTGSNCMVGRREIFEKVGLFPNLKSRGMAYESAVAGKKYANRITELGYKFLVTKEILATDYGWQTHSYRI